ncbi:MAG TPA: hypothetical protein VFH53_01135 [Phycisphaerae bacterium]|nr:hypothetical protein [Phycisphaerae bacterium]
MRELSLIAAIVAILAATIVLAQDELKPAAPPAASEPAGAPVARANPFSPLDSGAALAPWSASPPPLETSPAQADAASQTATPSAAKLNGILYCESKPLVLINDLIAGVGDEVCGMRVTAIARDKVTLAGPRGVWMMTPLQPEARPAPAVPPAPAETGKPAVEPEAAASAESQAPEAAGGTPVVAAETTDQPIGKENP